MTRADERLLVDDQRLEVRRIGSPSHRTPTLVFLHEGLGSVALWKDFPDRLAGAIGWPALVYSRRGYGGSDPAPLPRPITFLEDEAIAVLPRLLDAAGVGDAVLVGHSDGASIALIHAATFPPPPRGPVRAVIAEAPHVFVEEVTLASIRRAGDAYRRGDLRRRLERYHADVDAAFWGFHDVWLDPRLRALAHRPPARLDHRAGAGHPGRGRSLRHDADRSRPFVSAPADRSRP